MTQEMMNDVLSAIAAENASAGAEISRLTREDRRDEADMVRIRLNVANIVKSVLEATNREDASGTTALRKLTGIAETWRKHRGEADAHGDAEAAAIEDVKLSAMAGWLKRMEG